MATYKSLCRFKETFTFTFTFTISIPVSISYIAPHREITICVSLIVIVVSSMMSATDISDKYGKTAEEAKNILQDARNVDSYHTGHY